MDLFLMQHGAAVSDDVDPARPLSEGGREEVVRVLARAGAAGVRVERCVHSGKLRAEQTAVLLGQSLGADVEARTGLNPKDPVAPVLEWLASQARAAKHQPEWEAPARDAPELHPPYQVAADPTADPAAPAASLAIVGHLPFLDRLASVLVAGEETSQVLRFRNGALVKLVPKDEAPGQGGHVGGASPGWRIDWVLPSVLA
jgi:phosphohistidine phosphatase